MKITKELLETWGACSTERFAAQWPDGAELTLEVVQKALALELDIVWFARHVLSEPLLAEYERRIAIAWAECDRQVAEILIGLLWPEEKEGGA